MRQVVYLLLAGVADVWLHSYLNALLGFSKLAVLYMTTTVLGAVVLLIRYPVFRKAKNAANTLCAKWKEKQKEPDYVPSEEDRDEQKSMVFVIVYIPALVLIVIPGIVTDVIGILLLVPAISKRCTDRISGLDYYRLMKFSDAVDEHPDALVNVDNYLWIRMGLVVIIWVSFVWLWGVQGAVAALFASIAMVMAINQIRRFYCAYAIHADGLRGYNKSKELLGQYNRGGGQHHVMMRGIWMHRWARFLYHSGTVRWSWRPYALLVALAGVIYWSPLVGGAVVAAFLSMLLKVANDISVPTVLYLGSSDPASHALLRKLCVNSGIEWVSLLDDSVFVDVPADSNEQENDPLSAADLMIQTNRWSLRMNEAYDWLAVVKDFIRASAVIVVRPENEGAVREELDILANAEYLQRVIVIHTEQLDTQQLPEQLNKCVLGEDEAMTLIAKIRTSPKIFREWVRDRFNRAGFEAAVSRQVS